MGILRVCVLLTIAVAFAFAAPATYGNTANNTITGGIKIAPEPQGRGTFGIIFSCTATFVFCIWTTVHPNIIANTTRRMRLYHKSIYTICCIFIPEGILVCAYGQWREAKEIEEVWRNHFSYSDDKLDMANSLGMDGAFFVLMGGFIVAQPSDAGPDAAHNPPLVEPKTGPDYISMILPPSDLRSPSGAKLPQSKQMTTTLTPAGFLWHLRRGSIDKNSFDKRAIVDKGKSSNVAKLIASIQAVWLLTQCASRLASHMPLTLLEVHIAIQVLCTLIIYGFWWSKPLDINEPIMITLNTPDATNIPVTWEASHDYSRTRLFTTTQAPKFNTAGIKALLDIAMYLDSNGLGARVRSEDLEGYELGATVRSGVQGEPDQRLAKPGTTRMTGAFLEVVLTSIVGGLHLLSWNSDFPTPMESWLWRACCLGMIVCPMVAMLVGWYLKLEHEAIDCLWRVYVRKDRPFVSTCMEQSRRLCKMLGDNAGDANGREGKWGLGKNVWYWIYFTIGWGCIVFIFVYALSILYITVESYISLRDPADGVYLTPVWSDYWPHL